MDKWYFESKPSHCASPRSFYDVIQFIDKKNRYHLLLDLSDGEEENTRRLTAGITIQTKHFQIEGVNSLGRDVVVEKRWRFAIEPFAADLVIEMKNGAIDLRTLNKLVL